MTNSCFFILLVTLSFLLQCTKLCWCRNMLNSTTDQTSLLAFKNNIIPASNSLLANEWSTNTSVCDWIGVTCGIKHQRVTSLNLSSFNLSGTIAPHLGNLTFLRYLDISFNNFTGLVPKKLSNLRRLQQINVGVNSLSGDIPYWLGTLPQLEHIQLNNNTFTGHIPLSLFNTTSNIRFLDMGFNFLGGKIPQEIGNFSSLETLNLQYNQFTASSIPYGIFESSSIREINLMGCRLSGTLPTDMCNNITKLKTLNLRDNQLSGQIPPNIHKCRDLEDLRLSFNRFDGNIPSEIGSLVNLKILTLANNSLGGGIPKQLGNLTSLELLYLGSNQLTGELPKELSNLAHLEEFNLRNNDLSGSIPSFIFNMSSTMRRMSLGSNHFSGNLPSTIGMGLSLLNLEALYLGNNRLSGPIPSYITNASKLTELELSRNSLSGPVPSFGNLRLLQDLRLFNNNLTGDLGFISSLTNCRNLQQLDISRNPLNGIVPTSVGNLSTSLQIFAAYECNITGEIPFQIGNLTSLRALAFGANQLTGELPQQLSNLAYLNELYLNNNGLSGPIPSFMFNLSSTLMYMNLQSNQFFGNLPLTIGMGISLLNIEKLLLDNNRLSGPIPSYITNASKLTLLQMSNNSFSGPIPSFGNLKELQILQLSDNNLTGDLGDFLSSLTMNCPYLKRLGISRNQLNGVLPTSIWNLSTSLQLLEAYDCNITGEIPPDIGNLTSLQTLSLDSNHLTGFIPTTLGKLNNLQGLQLFDNRLQGYIPPDICLMRNLVNLELYGNMLTGPIPECLGEMNTLREVNLGSNNLNSTIPSSFWNLTDLLDLNFSSNYLSGQISSDIGNLKVINFVDLSWNQFSGDIPSSIDISQSIEFLSLAHNNFEGSIPESLGDIINLRLLDLSNNNLTGVIPKSFENLRYLGYFNVSYNKLEGEIPTGGAFVNFTGQSFLQNSALCGATRFNVPSCGHIHTRSMNVSTLFVRYILPPIISVIILVIIIIVLIKRRKHDKVSVPTEIPLGTAWRRISYQELVRGTSAFSETNLLGIGGFGSVFRGTLSDGLNVAIKVFKLHLEGAYKSFDNESEILSSVRHRNLIRIIGCCCNTEFRALILAYMPNGSLEKWLYSESYFLDVLQRLNISLDVALALEYLHHGHTFPVVHCDIKPSNVLLDEDMTAHVADFGISKLFDEGEVVIQTKTLATIGYAAPEYGSEGKVSTNGDVYSYGILLLEMFTGKKPTDDMFSGEMSLKDWVSEALLQEIAVNELVAPGLLTTEDRYLSGKEECVSSVFGLSMKCLAFSPEERINTIQVVAALQKIKTRFLATNRNV